MDSTIEDFDCPIVGSVSTRTKILAYLGELKHAEFVAVKQLINDLNLRFTTAKNILTQLEQEWLVEKKVTTRKGTAAFFRISPTAVVPRVSHSGCGNGVVNMHENQQQEVATVPFVPPEWSSQYGKHPYGT
jgi:hypothetical protein